MPAQPGLDRPVCFTRSAPFDVHSGQLVFYDVAESSTTSRSEVLSIIAEAGGEAPASLDDITLSEFQQWMTFVEGNSGTAEEKSFVDLCTVVKVATVLAMDDSDVAKWVAEAAERLVQYSLSPHSKSSIQSIDDSLSLLPEGAQYRIFSAAASDTSRMYSLLAFLPACYHTTIVAATITPSKALDLPFSRESIPAFVAAAALPASPASVLSLHSHCRGQVTQPADGLNISEHLAQALQHNKSLTSISIASHAIDAASAKLLLQAIATLTSLQSLHLGAESSCFPGQSVAMLQQALPSLRHLEDLKLMLPKSLSWTFHPESQAPCCLATALSPAAALTSLHIAINEVCSWSLYTVAASLALPRLRQLTVDVGSEWNLASALIECLRAPLTSLSISNGRSTRQGPPVCSEADGRQFVRNLSKFALLRSLSAALPVYLRMRAPVNWDNDGDVDIVMDVVESGDPAALAALTHLQQLTIAAVSSVLSRAVPILATALTALTSLDLDFARRRHSDELPWATVCRNLCKMSLKQLHLTPRAVIDEGPGLASLRALTQLSALAVTKWICLRDVADCEVLAGMTGLRRLSLTGLIIDDSLFLHEDGRAVARALLALSALTSLTACIPCSMVAEELESEYNSRAAPDAWPELQELSLHFGPPTGWAERTIKWAVGLPALMKFTATCERDEWEDAWEPDGWLDEDVVLEVVEACQCLAAEAGVELVLPPIWWHPRPVAG